MLSKQAFDQDYDFKDGSTELQFQYKLRFGNNLPDIPSDTKFIPAETLQINRFVPYYNTQLEQNMKMNLDFGLDLGIHTELADLDIYAVDPNNTLQIHPSDAILVEDDSKTSVREKTRACVHRKPVPFMRKSVATMSYRRMGVGKDRPETQIGYGLAKKGEIPEALYRTRTEQIAAIEKTFVDVKKLVKKHYSKKGVYAVEECPVLPDFTNFQFIMTQVTFDKGPEPDLSEGLRKLALENSYICDMHGILGHFTPTEETLQRILEENDDEKEFDRSIPLDYVLDRDYTGTQQPVRENFYLAKDGREFKFGPLNSHSVSLSRVRRTGKEKMQPCKLEITRREVSDEEFRERRRRMFSLVAGTNNESFDSDQEMEDHEDHEMSTQETIRKVDSDYEPTDKETTPPPLAVKEEVVSQESQESESSETESSDDSDDSSEVSSSLSDGSEEENANEESPPATPGRFKAGSDTDAPMQSVSPSADLQGSALDHSTSPVIALRDPKLEPPPSPSEYEPAFPYLPTGTTAVPIVDRVVKQELPDYD